jgi:hypothetical protein
VKRIFQLGRTGGLLAEICSSRNGRIESIQDLPAGAGIWKKVRRGTYDKLEVGDVIAAGDTMALIVEAPQVITVTLEDVFGSDSR